MERHAGGRGAESDQAAIADRDHPKSLGGLAVTSAQEVVVMPKFHTVSITKEVSERLHKLAELESQRTGYKITMAAIVTRLVSQALAEMAKENV